MAICFLAAVLFLALFPQQHPILFVIVAMLVGSLPDIDTQNSKIGHTFPIVAFLVNLFLGHRGLTHSVFVPIGAYFLFRHLALPWIGIAFVVGYCAHIAADALTKEGINLLHPIAQFRISGFMRTGGMTESFVFLAVIILDVIVMVNLFL